MFRGTTRVLVLSGYIYRPCTGAFYARLRRPIFLERLTLCLNLKPPNSIVNLCKRAVLVARYEQSASAAVRASILISSELVLLKLAGGRHNPLKRRRHSAKVFLKLPCRRLLAKIHRFRRSYHVSSSNSEQSHSCQTRLPCSRAAAAAASAPSGDLSHRQTNKEGSPEGPGDFFPTRPQPPSALKHDAAPPTLPPAYLLASDSRDSVEIKLLHAP